MPATLQQHLPPGARVSRYELCERLGDGGFAITYRARDSHLPRDVAIKEFLSKDLALREPGGAAVLARSGQEGEYRLGLQRFLDEAKTLAQFNHPNIVRVIDYFEANDTAYLVMFYERGCSIQRSLRQQWPSPLASAATRPTGVTRTPFGLACQRPWTALHLLARTPAIADEARLARNADRPTEHDNMEKHQWRRLSSLKPDTRLVRPRPVGVITER